MAAAARGALLRNLQKIHPNRCVSCCKLQRQTKKEANEYWQANPLRQTRGFSGCSSLLGQPEKASPPPDDSDDHHSHKDDQKSWTHFGYEDVLESEKKQKVYDVFANVAESYDLMNDVMSGGLHRLWKDHFVRKCNPTPGRKLLDVAGGTGDIAFRYLDGVLAKQRKSAINKDSLKNDIVISDINKSMLEVGKQRAKNKGIHEALSFVVGDAEKLPFEEDTFDLYTIAFGIRNVTHIDRVLDEAYRVLRPGGRFMCLEFSDVPNPFIKSVYDSYSFQVIPVMGEIIAQDWKSYQYLVESIRQFPDQETFTSMIEDAGFANVTHENLLFGVVAIHSGFKI